MRHEVDEVRPGGNWDDNLRGGGATDPLTSLVNSPTLSAHPSNKLHFVFKVKCKNGKSSESFCEGMKGCSEGS